MGLLNPLFLLAGAAVAIPLVLHLFRRHDTRRVVFPAIRYLLRTEKEHARTIRARQLLLLLLRVAAILLLAVIGSRPFLRGPGGVHEPTALVIILDNSMSSGRIQGESRTLDRLKNAALASIDRASPEDRVWLMRAGEPWEDAYRESLESLAAQVRSIEPSAAAADLGSALTRATSLAAQSGLDSREIHLISDLQATGFSGAESVPLGETTLVVYGADPVGGDNAFLDSLQVGGGLAPMANEPAQLAVRLGGEPTTEIPARLIVDGRIRGAARGRSGETVVFPFGPFTSGTISGYVETDPDALAADDRYYFSVSVRPPPRVAVSGTPSSFLSDALSVLAEAGRIETASLTAADVIVAVGGAGMGTLNAAIVVPDADPTGLPALNRRLAASGIPWRYELTASSGEAGIAGNTIPVDLSSVRVRDVFRLQPSSNAQPAQTLVRLTSGEPWLVEVTADDDRYLLFASPMEEAASSLPVTAVMIPMLDWMLSVWSAGVTGGGAVTAGDPFLLPNGAAAVTDPTGARHAISGSSEFRGTGVAGIYAIHGEDRELGYRAVNPASRESLMRAIDEEDLHRLIEGDVRLVREADRWGTSIFVSGQGPEIWRPLLLVLLGLLLLESVVAAAGPERSGA